MMCEMRTNSVLLAAAVERWETAEDPDAAGLRGPTDQAVLLAVLHRGARVIECETGLAPAGDAGHEQVRRNADQILHHREVRRRGRGGHVHDGGIDASHVVDGCQVGRHRREAKPVLVTTRCQ